MNKRALIQVFEKVKTQTKGEALRVIAQLSGVVGDPLNEKKGNEIKPEKGLPLEIDDELKEKANPE